MFDALSDTQRIVGTYVTDTVDVPTDVTGVRVHIDRTNLKNVTREGATAADQIVAFFYLERRVGKDEWEHGGGVGFGGGEQEEISADGKTQISTETTLKVLFHPRFTGKKGFQLRGFFELYVELKTLVKFEWLYDPLSPRPELVHHSVAVEDYDAAEITSGNTLTIPALAPVGSDTLAVAACAGARSGGGQTVSSCTRNGEGFTEDVDTGGVGWSNWFNHYLSHRIAPSSGSYSTAIVFTASSMLAAGCVYMLSGVDQSTPVTDTIEDEGVSSGCSQVLGSETDGLVIDIMHSYGNPTVGAGQTAVFEHNQSPGGPAFYESSSYEAGAASVTMSWTFSNAEWSQALMAIAPAAGAPPGDVLPQSIQAIRQGVIGSPCQLHPIEEGYVS